MNKQTNKQMAKETENREMCHNVSGNLLKYPFWFLLLVFEDVNTYGETVNKSSPCFQLERLLLLSCVHNGCLKFVFANLETKWIVVSDVKHGFCPPVIDVHTP